MVVEVPDDKHRRRRVLCFAELEPFFYIGKNHMTAYTRLADPRSVLPLVSDFFFLVRMLEHSFSCPVFLSLL
jgi:hypothetical protein